MRTGGIASTTSGIITGTMPRPSQTNIRTRSPKVGSARAPADTKASALPPRPVCPVTRPIGRPMAEAIARAAAVYWTCSHTRCGMPS
jgi:hypothetical protein